MHVRHWLLLVVAAASAAGATLAVMTTGRRRHDRRRVQSHEHRTDLHAWENEGGNLAPVHAAVAS